MQDDPILRRFRAALDAAYGPRLARVVLYGSRARGEARADSDYDVAVFLEPLGPLWEELGTLAGLGAPLLSEGALISAKPFAAAAWHGASPLMAEIRRDGLAL